MTPSSTQKGLIALVLAAIFPLVIFLVDWRQTAGENAFVATPVPLFNEGLATSPVAKEAEKAIGRSKAKAVVAGGADIVDQTHCLAQAIYYEARGEPFLGQVGVAFVVLNRVNSHRWPASTCGVVYQGRERSNCQFAFACDRVQAPFETRAWTQALRIAKAVLEGRLADPTDNALYFHSVRPGPATPVPTAQLGNHYFYRSLEG